MNAPLFLPGESKYRDSIEGGYASMARFVAEHPNPFGWNPYQYEGLPTHMWYLPGIPYLSAAAIRILPFLKPEHVYRLVVTTLACLGPVTLFLMAYFFTRSRGWALAAALAYTFLSPSYGLFYIIDHDRGQTYVPWRIQVLIKYGEGPHNAGLMLLPLAVIACWCAAVGRARRHVVTAACLLAAITLLNWVAALALAWCVLMLLLTGTGLASYNGFRTRRILGAALLAYLLACFWLTPHFIQTTLFNWPVDAFGYKVRAAQYWLVAGLAAGPVLLRLLFLRFPTRHYLCFLMMCLYGFAWLASFHYGAGLDTIPESRRYVIEAEMFFFAALFEVCRLLHQGGRFARRLAIALPAAAAALGSIQIFTYVTRTWLMLRPAPREGFIEYQIATQLDRLRPEGRVFVSGGTRFRLNSWFLIPQLGGTFESGVVSRTALYITYHVRTGFGRDEEFRGRDAVNLLRAVGVEYAAVHGGHSREHWKDIAHPNLFEGLLEPVVRLEDDTIYRLPFRGLAHAVRPDDLPPGLPIARWAGTIDKYVRSMDDPARPRLTLRWLDASRFEITGPIPAGMLVSVRVAYDPGWHAIQDGRPIRVQADTLQHLILHTEASAATRIVVSYPPPLEQIAGTGVSLLTVVLLIRPWRMRRWRSGS